MIGPDNYVWLYLFSVLFRIRLCVPLNLFFSSPPLKPQEGWYNEWQRRNNTLSLSFSKFFVFHSHLNFFWHNSWTTSKKMYPCTRNTVYKRDGLDCCWSGKNLACLSKKKLIYRSKKVDRHIFQIILFKY